MLRSSLTGPKFQTSMYSHKSLSAIANDLIQECKMCSPGSRLSKCLRDRLIAYVYSHSIVLATARIYIAYLFDCQTIAVFSLPREVRKDVVKIMREGCAALFVACRRGNVEISEFLVTNCDADSEQRGMFENPEDQSVHCVTPLWCAAVSGKLAVVKCLVRLGSNINAISDTGSTPVRSACFMTNMEIVQYLVEHGADITKPNFNGGTCLINAVQSVELCTYLISKGVDVNARDIQNKTALHYAIHEHR